VIAHRITTRVTWECIHVGTIAQGRRELESCKQDGLFAVAVNASAIHTEESLLSAIATAMNFPSYFGMNWDALDECLRDLSWLDPKGVLLIMEDSKALWREASLSIALIQSWLFCAEEWARSEVPFHLAFTWD
jgi:hypothetical protein